MTIRFPYNYELKEYVKKYKGTLWSTSKRCFYLHYSETVEQAFTAYLNTGGYVVLKKSALSAISVEGKRKLLKSELPALTPEKAEVQKKFIRFLEGKLNFYCS